MWLVTAGIIIIALVAGGSLLALVSDAFAYAVSRGVETVFDFIEYRAALRREGGRVSAERDEGATYAATLRRAA